MREPYACTSAKGKEKEEKGGFDHLDSFGKREEEKKTRRRREEQREHVPTASRRKGKGMRWYMHPERKKTASRATVPASERKGGKGGNL